MGQKWRDTHHEEQKASQRKWYHNNAEQAKQKVKERRQQTKEWFDEYKSTLCCSICGESHPSCIEFHHRDGEQKDNDISKMVKFGYSKERIMREVQKCDVLCANCHRKKHVKDGTFGAHRS